MAQLIDKDAIALELEKRMQELRPTNTHQMQVGEKIDRDVLMWLNALTWVKKILDTLDVKEVDLDKALSDLDKDIKEFVTTEEFENESTIAGHYWAIAKHAFLLGLKTQKGE